MTEIRMLAGRLLEIVKRVVRQPLSAVSLALFTLFLILALFGPVIAPYQANQQIVDDVRQPPSGTHWFGTDHLGRDVFSRVVLGARDVLSLAGLGTVIAVISGAVIGLFSGYQGGWIDEVIMRVFDSILSLPALLLALLLLGSVGPSRNGVLIVIVIAYIPIVARVVRSVVLSVKEKGFVASARVQGEPTIYILFREIFPSTLPALTVEGSLRFSYAIFLVASLGFLGVGVQPPSPDWGLMVKEGRANFSQTPWALYFPAGAIAILVISVNILADTLKQVLEVPSKLRR